MNNEKLTIKDIAELAQVSKGTVSKALNNQPGVGKETKERILKLIKQLDFHPNSAAQALASNKTENLGLFIPHLSYNEISGSYWAAIISGIVEQANKFGYNILLFTIEEGADLYSAYNLLLKKKRVDGFIVGTELLDTRSISALCISKIPFILLGKNSMLNHFYVDINNYKASFEMTKYMIGFGYKRIALLASPEKLSYSKPRIQGYLDAIKEEGLDFSFHISSPYTKKDSYAAIDIIMKQKPDALFVGSGGDSILHTIDKFNELNIKVPEFGLAAFDDYIYMDYISPKITTIRQPFLDLGSSSVEMLTQMIEKGEPDSPQIIHSATIIPRESCGEKLSHSL
ncbi:MAG: LacI family DNA-binding transcriptional regulator [Spirochaetales bacterium]|nr:LacI family DNA-binding transcriptional regulator [Spirochaetales bacterium]